MDNFKQRKRRSQSRGRIPPGVVEIGQDSRARLQWLIDSIAYADLIRVTARDEAHLFFLLRLLMAATGGKSLVSMDSVPDDRLQDIQRAVRESLEALCSRRPYERRVVLRATVQVEETTHGARGQELALTKAIAASFTDCVLISLVELLKTVPLSLVRRCVYRGARSPERCGRVFVGKKRQVCCAAHRRIKRQEQNRVAQERLRRRRAGQD